MDLLRKKKKKERNAIRSWTKGVIKAYVRFTVETVLSSREIDAASPALFQRETRGTEPRRRSRSRLSAVSRNNGIDNRLYAAEIMRTTRGASCAQGGALPPPCARHPVNYETTRTSLPRARQNLRGIRQPTPSRVATAVLLCQLDRPSLPPLLLSVILTI